MTRVRAVLTLACISLVGVVSLLTGTVRAQAAGENGSLQGRARAPVRLQLSVGYQGIYRGSAWTPLRIAVRNNGSADLTGTLEIPQAASSATGAQPTFHGLYEAPIVVPAGGEKDVKLYVPGSGIQGRVNVRLLAGRTLLASASTSPTGLDFSSLLIGVLAGGPGEMAWIAPAIQQRVTTHVIRLSSATIDPVAQALATFDMIVLTNTDTSQLDRAQIVALQQYVRQGGSLLVVGGPTWQETLRPLQGALLPGKLTGMRVLRNLNGLLPLVPGHGLPGKQSRAAVSVLSQPSGTVLAAQGGVPLVVRATAGTGTVEYLAFDPSLSPVSGWAAKSGLTEHLVAMAAPLAISRTWSPSGFRVRFQRLFQSAAVTGELSNLPSATLPFLALFAVLTLGYVLILGPANFLLLRRIRRQSLAWITIPLLGVAYLGLIFAIVPRERASAAVLNTVGLVTLDGNTSTHPATFYAGLATPMSGDYRLTYGSAALPAPLPQLSLGNGFSFRDASTLHNTPLGMRMEEDPQTAVTFLSMRRWSVRDISLQTSVHIPGAVQSTLTTDARGDLVGYIRNDTNLDLLDPVIVAGQTAVRIPDILAGKSVYARLRPSAGSTGGQGASLAQAYGGSDPTGGDDFFRFRDCCNGPFYPLEEQLIDRVRNAVSMLSQVQGTQLSSLGAVMLVGWTDRPLGGAGVNGSAPQRRDLTLIGTPLSVHFPARGAFRLLSGTIGSQLVDMLPRAPQSSCCSFGFGRDAQQDATVGNGGFLTFEFDLPTGGNVRFQRLGVSVSSRDNGVNTGHVYDWRARQWVKVDLLSGDTQLPDPNRFVSPQGRVMLRLDSGGDLDITDPYHDVEISGAGSAS